MKKSNKEVNQKVYYTEYERNKENFEPQTTYQSFNISEYSLNFGPKASNTVSFILHIVLLALETEAEINLFIIPRILERRMILN
jgi:hypothetical protein